jgi:hypothetical protein
VLDWDAWFGRIGHRRVAATAQGQHGRGGAKSSEGTGSAGQHVVVEASGRPRGAARRVGWLGIQVGDRAHWRMLGGGRWNSDSGEQVAWPGLRAGVQAQVVQEEGLGVLRRHWSQAEQWLTEGMPTAGGGDGSVLVRGEEASAFIAGRKAVRDASLRAKETTLRWGRDMAGVRQKGAATCGRPAANDGAWATRRGRCASGM